MHNSARPPDASHRQQLVVEIDRLTVSDTGQLDGDAIFELGWLAGATDARRTCRARAARANILAKQTKDLQQKSDLLSQAVEAVDCALDITAAMRRRILATPSRCRPDDAPDASSRPDCQSLQV